MGAPPITPVRAPVPGSIGPRRLGSGEPRRYQEPGNVLALSPINPSPEPAARDSGVRDSGLGHSARALYRIFSLFAFLSLPLDADGPLPPPRRPILPPRPDARLKTFIFLAFSTSPLLSLFPICVGGYRRSLLTREYGYIFKEFFTERTPPLAFRSYRFY